MAKLWQIIGRANREDGEKRFSVDDYANLFSYNGGNYIVANGTSAWQGTERDDYSFTSYVQSIYKRSGPVFSCILARMLVFSEARFQYQRLRNGRPGDLFGDSTLKVLETPWPNGTTGDLLSRMEQDVSLAGNSYTVREKNRLRRLRPDWVEIVLSAPPAESVTSDIIGYAYYPGGRGGSDDPVLYLPEDVAHYAPIPDPAAQYRGMSWVTPVLREIEADGSATDHKRAFFRNGATPQLLVSFKESVTPDQFKKFMETTNETHNGADNAYKTLYLGGGADAQVVGRDFHQLDFKNTQGAGETRVASAAGVPPVIAGFSEGLESATYSNYGQARRRFADGTMRPLWRSAAGALATITPVPSDSRLAVDTRDIAFLREDAKDAAEIESTRATTIAALVTAGYKPDAVIDAVMAEDLARLVGKHTGLYSVQLQPPLSSTAPQTPTTPTKDTTSTAPAATEKPKGKNA